MTRVRDFSPEPLDSIQDSRLCLPWSAASGVKGNVSLFTIFLPRLHTTKYGKKETICTAMDEDLLQDMLVRHFDGCTMNPQPIQGIGRRGQELETNVHHAITVLASRWRGTWRYFRALRKELEACSGEQQVLILHLDTTIV